MLRPRFADIGLILAEDLGLSRLAEGDREAYLDSGRSMSLFTLTLLIDLILNSTDCVVDCSLLLADFDRVRERVLGLGDSFVI